MKKTCQIIPVIAVVSLLCAGCGNSLYEKAPSNYTDVTSIKGVTFSMPENFLEAATAITNINKDMDYNNSVYLYKNGETTYMLFDIDTAVIAVENKTTFDFLNTDDAAESLENNSLDGIWFSPEGKNLDYTASNKGDEYKMIATVDADVAITSDTYGTFAGKMAYLQTGNFECSMFVGYIGESYNDLSKDEKEIIDNITKSFALSGDTEYYEAQATEAEETTESIESAEDTSVTYNETEQVINNTESVISETEATNEVVITDDTEVADSPVIATEVIDTTEVDEVPDSEKTTAASRLKNQGVTVSDNQKEIDGENQFSDIYHMLKIGDVGYFCTSTYKDQAYMINNITIEELYTGDEAISLIKNYYASGNRTSEYQDAPDGYSWHVVKYSLGKAPYYSYANIKIEGLDGSRLKHWGVPCTTRTYDMIDNFKTKTNLYCYYAVPNGTSEYVLEVGDRRKTTEEGAYETAFFYVSKF